jgi:MarR family transcriptional regulator, transcriptional regulator for hemolysin
MCVHMESFGFEISETALVMRRDFDRRASGLGVTRAQWRVLARLNIKNGVRQVDLAEALDIEPITLCRMIDRLEDAGLVERRRDEIDRRAWNIFLTDKAKPLLDEVQSLARQLQEDALMGISQEDQRHALEILARVRANINRSGAAPARKAS